MLLLNYLMDLDEIINLRYDKKDSINGNYICLIYIKYFFKKKKLFPIKVLKPKTLLNSVNNKRILSLVSFRSDSLFFFIYYQQYFSTLLKMSITLNILNSRDVIPKNLIYYVVHSVKLIKWKRYYITHNNEIIEALFIALWLKNIKLFMHWMLNYFEKTNLKKHRKLFLLLKLLLGKLLWSYNIFLQLKGLRVTLLGKFGKAGSVRKTRRYIRKGQYSYTSKNVAMVSQTNVIRTLTGVFSIKFEVFF